MPEPLSGDQFRKTRLIMHSVLVALAEWLFGYTGDEIHRKPLAFGTDARLTGSPFVFGTSTCSATGPGAEERPIASHAIIRLARVRGCLRPEDTERKGDGVEGE